MHRPLGLLLAATIAATALGGASAAEAATPADGLGSLSQAAAEAHGTASAVLGGIALPTGTAGALRIAAVPRTRVESLDESVPVEVATKRYDIHVTSVGPTSSPTIVRLYAGTRSVPISVRRLVRVTVTRHGAKTATLATTTTFRRFVVMLTGLESDPLRMHQKHFASRASLVAALAHGLAIGAGEVTREYGAVLRFAQMSIDLGLNLEKAMEYLAKHPSATDLSVVPTTHTTAGSGGYSGSVTLSGTRSAFSATVTNDTDGSVLSMKEAGQSLTITYTVGGRTYTERF